MDKRTQMDLRIEQANADAGAKRISHQHSLALRHFHIRDANL
jgi:hypothetical protein